MPVLLLNDTGAAAVLIPQLLPLQDQFGGAVGGAYACRPPAHGLADLYRLLDEEQAAGGRRFLERRRRHS